MMDAFERKSDVLRPFVFHLFKVETPKKWYSKCGHNTSLDIWVLVRIAIS
jgi:hypothetical protein